MTIEATHLTGEDVHELVLQSSPTAQGIARAALRIVHSDMSKADAQLQAGDVEEALQIIAEAVEQLGFARNMLSGRVWTLQV